VLDRLDVSLPPSIDRASLYGAVDTVERFQGQEKAEWYTVLADPQMPVTSTLLDQAHNAIERKLFAMKGFHHPTGSQ
jgi:hypothetical protein